MSKKPDIIQISEAELASMTRDLDQIHKDQSLPAMTESLAFMNESIHEEAAAAEGLKDRRLGRRTFLLSAGAVAVGGVALAACGGTTGPSATTTTGPPESSSALKTDLAVTALAVSLENLAVAAYGDAIAAVEKGTYGPPSSIPPAVPVFATTAMSQHQAHANAWNGILTGAGKAKVTGVPTFAGTIVADFKKLTTIVEVLGLALMLENVAAQTYQVGSTVVTSVPGIQLAASIQPVEMQHAAILYFVLGKYPGIQDSSGTVLSFNPTSSAASVGDYTGPL